MSRWSRHLSVLALLCWLASLPLPAIDVGPATGSGWQLLLRGWRGILELNIGGFSWLANPLLILSALGVLWPPYRRIALPLACAALIAALSSFLFNAVHQNGFSIERFLVGFHVWMAAMIIQGLAAVNASTWPLTPASLPRERDIRFRDKF